MLIVANRAQEREGLPRTRVPAELLGALVAPFDQPISQIVICQNLAYSRRDRNRIERVEQHCRVAEILGNAARSAATTGVPHAIDSSAGSPKPSYRDGNASTDAAEYSDGISLSGT